MILYPEEFERLTKLSDQEMRLLAIKNATKALEETHDPKIKKKIIEFLESVKKEK